MKQRKKYTKEFKLDAISLVLEQNYTQAEASKNLGINANLLGRWIKEFQSEFNDDKANISIELLTYLKDWLIWHINGTDKLYTKCFNVNLII